METESGAKIAIRGKGSVKEGKGRSDAAHSSNQEEDLHCLIMADTEDKVNKAKQLIHNVIETVSSSLPLSAYPLIDIFQAASIPEGQNELKRNQLRELAALNGTLRDDENQACQNCGKIGHRKYDCPERQNYTASIICRVCGNAGHMARDCPDRQKGASWRNDGMAAGRPAGRIGGGDAVDREMEVRILTLNPTHSLDTNIEQQLMQELGGGSGAPAQIEAGPGGGGGDDAKPWQRGPTGGPAPWRTRNNDSNGDSRGDSRGEGRAGGGGGGGGGAPWARDRNRGQESQGDSYYGQGYGGSAAAPWQQAQQPGAPGAPGTQGYGGYPGYGGYGAPPGMPQAGAPGMGAPGMGAPPGLDGSMMNPYGAGAPPPPPSGDVPPPPPPSNHAPPPPPGEQPPPPPPPGA